MRIFLLLLASFYSTFLFAQETEQTTVSSNINIEARIVRSIELITVKSMTFENDTPGRQDIYVNPITDVNSGFMIAVGTPDAEFRLNYFQQRSLTRIDGPGSITFTYEISGNDIEEQSTSEILQYDNRNIRFNTEGRYYIWVGGRVDLANAPPGSYQGDFTIEIDYI